MDYGKLKIPFIKKEIIKNKANVFRSKYWNDSIPINIEKIIEQKLDIEIIPIPNLTNFCDTDALIKSDYKSIYVDNNKYMDEKYQNRLRFSLSHEIAHYILHKKLYKKLNITSYEKFYEFIEDIPNEQYSYLEKQADIFANCLLVPRKILIKEKSRLIKKLQNTDLINIEKEILYDVMADNLSKKFGVSSTPVKIALMDINNNNHC